MNMVKGRKTNSANSLSGRSLPSTMEFIVSLIIILQIILCIGSSGSSVCACGEIVDHSALTLRQKVSSRWVSLSLSLPSPSSYQHQNQYQQHQQEQQQDIYRCAAFSAGYYCPLLLLRGGGASHSASSSKDYPPSPFSSPPNLPNISAASQRLNHLLRITTKCGRTFITNNFSNLKSRLDDRYRKHGLEQHKDTPSHPSSSQQTSSSSSPPRSTNHNTKPEIDSNTSDDSNKSITSQQKSRGNYHYNPSSRIAKPSSPSSSVPIPFAVLASELSSPIKLVRIFILAFGVAEILDQLGVLYEDTPEVIKSQIDAWWQLDVQPFLVKWTDKARDVWERTIAPHFGIRSYDMTGKLVRMDGRIGSRLKNAVHRLKYHLKKLFFDMIDEYHENAKIAFAIGVAGGMVTFPIACSLIVRYVGVAWKPVVAVYGAAEAHHWCKLNGIRSVVDWLGDTPQTLGSVLDEFLETWRRWVRKRTPWGTADSISDSNRLLDYINKSPREINRLKDSSSSSPPTFFSRHQSGRPVDEKKSKSAGKESSSDSRDVQELLEDFRDWMVEAVERDIDGRQVRRRNKFIKQGFALGCLLGFAFLDQK